MTRKRKQSKLKLFRTGLTARQEKLFDTLIFLLKVLVLSIPLYFIIIFSVSLAPLQQLDGAVSSSVLRVMGQTVLQNGAYLTVGTQNPFMFYLSEDCTAWKSILFLFALIFAVPAVSMGKRLIGLGLGAPVLWLGNQARIVGVVLTERATTVQFAMFTHDYFWRAFLVLLVLGLWLAWMKPPNLSRRIYPKGTGILSTLRLKSFPRLISRKTKR